MEDGERQVQIGEDVVKSTTAAVINLLDAAMAAPDAPIAFAECFTFITTTGTQYTWTDVDYPVTLTDRPFSPTGHWCRD